MTEETTQGRTKPVTIWQRASLNSKMIWKRLVTTSFTPAPTRRMCVAVWKRTSPTRAYASTSFARDILSVADNLSRALDAIPADLREDERLKALLAGIEATGRELDKVFGQHGIQKVAAQGLPLDPNQHQAMIEVPHDAEPGTVIQVLQHGYTIKDRLLRPAMVAVAKKPESSLARGGWNIPPPQSFP
jgi:molecular chaperone GrpE